jgi:RHS repeat-associated protein
VARVNGNGHKVGPAIILKVMAGDKVDLGVQYYYNSMSNTNGPDLNPSDLLNSLASGLASLSVPAHGALAALDNSSSSPLLAALSSSIGNETGTGTSKPQAYLNWVLLDDQFNYVGGSNQSGALQVVGSGTQSNGQLQPALAYSGLPITKSGYLYVYVSNATPGWDVFFDNLSVKQYSGPMIEENHYYPFGLTMAGISDKAIKSKYAENKYRYGEKELNNEEFSDGSQLEVYDYNARTYDPQIGRFQAMDLLAGKHNEWSTYSYSLNSPIRYTDPTGMDNDDAASGMAQTSEENDDDGVQRVRYLYDPKTQQIIIQKVSEDEYQQATNGGTTNVVSLIFSYANNTGALVTPNWHGFVYNDNLPETGTGEVYKLTDAHFERSDGEQMPLPGGDETPSPNEMLHNYIHWIEFGFSTGAVSNAGNVFGKFGPQRYNYWVGKNMQVIFEEAHPRFFGNGATGSRRLMTEFGEGMERAARPLGVLASGMSLIQAGVDVYNGHYKAAGVHTLDAAMGLIGTFGGPVGWAVSGAYFISRFWWGNKEDE